MKTIEIRIKNMENVFSKTDKIIASYVTENPLDMSYKTITTAADDCGVSTSAMLRFVQKLGFAGYSEFKYELAKECHSSDSTMNQSDSILNQYANSILSIRDFVSEEQIKQLAKDIANAKRIFIYGNNRSGLTAKHFHLRLMQIEIVSLPITDAVLMKDLPYHTTEDALHIFISVNGNTPTCMEALKNIAPLSNTTVLLTMNAKSPYKSLVDNFILLPYVQIKSPYLDEQIIFHISLELAIPYIVEELEAKNNE